MRFLRWLFSFCQHDSYSWPKGRGSVAVVVCQDCGAPVAYSWLKMRQLDALEEWMLSRKNQRPSQLEELTNLVEREMERTKGTNANEQN